jgi:hypothetical protein
MDSTFAWAPSPIFLFNVRENFLVWRGFEQVEGARRFVSGPGVEFSRTSLPGLEAEVLIG